MSAFQSACASSCRGQRGSEESKERRLAFPANSVTLWALWVVFWAFPGAVEAAGVVLDVPEAAEGVDDEAVASEALLACLWRLGRP